MHAAVHSSPSRVGVWFIGALGDIAATTMVGAKAIRAGLVSPQGLITDTPPFDQLSLAQLSGLVFGGIDVRSGSIADSAESLYRVSRTISRELLDAVTPELAAVQDDILVDRDFAWRTQAPRPHEPTLREIVARQCQHIDEFRHKHNLNHLVAVDLASAEPLPARSIAHSDLTELEAAFDANRKDVISPSMLSCYAALSSGCSFINFTPNFSIDAPALQTLAAQQGLPYYGNDGKTGETLIKTALAPMFAQRALRVMSWEGTNMLGNGDGKTLNKPENRVAKLENKECVLERILGYPVHAGVSINYVPSLGDWKTAWDLIHFQGFLDVPMSMQFTWQGCDSILAAPLVLDMVRFAEFAARHGEAGPMMHLAAFFKNPLGASEMAFYPQFDQMRNYADRHLARRASTVSSQRG